MIYIDEGRVSVGELERHALRDMVLLEVYDGGIMIGGTPARG